VIGNRRGRGPVQALMGGEGEAEGAAGGGGVEAGGEEDWEALAADWLDRVVSAAAGLYGDAVLRIPELSAQVRQGRPVLAGAY
jgi:hypothetical protein